MIHKIQYTDPENLVDYFLVYKEEDPAAVQIIAPRLAEGILIPSKALEYLLFAYRLHTQHDIFEHHPVHDWCSEEEP
jgi:hypothetical protein